MAVDAETVMQLAKRYADDVRRVMPVDKVVLFGSYANGTADEHSDVDICFFLKTFGGKQRVEILIQLLGLISEHKKACFEPLAYRTSELYNDNPFVKEILRTGIELG